MDDLNKKSAGERSKINMHEDYEVKYWTKQLGVSRDELEKAVDKVGNSAAAVRKESSGVSKPSAIQICASSGADRARCASGANTEPVARIIAVVDVCVDDQPQRQRCVPRWFEGLSVLTGKPAVRRVFVDGRGQFARKPGEKLVLQKAGLLL
jgi:hypothetical protein